MANYFDDDERNGKSWNELNQLVSTQAAEIKRLSSLLSDPVVKPDLTAQSDASPASSGVVERLRETAAERRKAAASDENQALAVIARISRADAVLMEEAASRITALEAALEPFAFGDALFEVLYKDMSDDEPANLTVKLGDLRRARAARGGEG